MKDDLRSNEGLGNQKVRKHGNRYDKGDGKKTDRLRRKF